MDISSPTIIPEVSKVVSTESDLKTSERDVDFEDSETSTSKDHLISSQTHVGLEISTSITNWNASVLSQNLNFNDSDSTTNDNWSSSDTLQKSECNSTQVLIQSSDCGTNYKIVSAEAYKNISGVLKWIQAVLCIIALVTNVLTIVVFLSQTQRSTNLYLIAIAIADMLIAVGTCIGILYTKYFGDLVLTDSFYLGYYFFFCELYFNTVLQRTLYFWVLLVSIERFLVVTFPLKAKDFWYMRRPKLIITTSFLSVAIFHIFSPLRFVMVELFHSPTNSTRHTIQPSQLFLENGPALNAASTASVTIFVYMLLAAALVMNLIMVGILKHHSRTAGQMKTGSDAEKAAKRERKTTITIVTSSLIFLVLALPLNSASIVQNLRRDLVGPMAPYGYLFRVVFELSHVLTIVSFSTDFMAYVCLSSSFRKTFFRLMRIRQTAAKAPGNAIQASQLSSQNDTKF